MRDNIKQIITSIAVLGLCGCQHAQQMKPARMHEYATSIREEMHKHPNFSQEKYKAAIDRKYDSLFKKSKPAMPGYSDDALKQTFVMYDTLSFYTLGSRYLTGMEDAFTELKERNLEKTNCDINYNKGSCVEDMFSAYVNQGNLLSAKRIQGEYPKILPDEQVPETREPAEYLEKARNLYNVSADGKRFDLEPVDISTRPVMVAIMATDCHFSRRILKNLLTDSGLKRDFEKYGLIIMPLNTSLSFIPEVVRWNTENPKLPFRIHSDRADLRAGWEKLNFTSIPQFYFMRNGEVVDYIGGWGPNDEEFTVRLRQGLDKLKIEQNK